MATQSVTPAAELTFVGTDPNSLTGDARVFAWADRLVRKLDARALLLQEYRDYYEGNHPKTFATEKWVEVFGDKFGQIVDNWGGRVVDSATERMLLQGFRRVGDGPGPTGEVPADDAADAIWRRSRMHVRANVAHTDCLATGYSYVSVHLEAGGKARFRVEDPLETIIEYDPETVVDRLAAIKRWRGLDGRANAEVYLPDEVVTIAEGEPGKGWRIVDRDAGRGEVPIFEFANDPNVRGEGKSDQAAIMSLGDAEEKLLADLMIASEYAAYPQRVLLGGEVPVGDDDKPLGAAIMGITRLFAVEDADAKIQEFSAADLGNYVKAIELLGQRIASIANIPPHYLLGNLANLSGDALAAAESGLVSKVRSRIKVVGETWSDAMALAIRLETGEDAEFVTLWENPERVSDAQKGDYLVKLKNVGVPDQALWEEIKPPAVVKRWSHLADQQAERDAELDARAAGISGPSGLPIEA